MFSFAAHAISRLEGAENNKSYYNLEKKKLYGNSGFLLSNNHPVITLKGRDHLSPFCTPLITYTGGQKTRKHTEVFNISRFLKLLSTRTGMERNCQRVNGKICNTRKTLDFSWLGDPNTCPTIKCLPLPTLQLSILHRNH